MAPSPFPARETDVVRKLWDALVDGRERRPHFALVVSGLFCVALSLMHSYHELWRDEMHCWSVGRNAAGLWELLTGARRYDGHPFLWYYLLHLVSRFSRSEIGLHLVTIALATSSAYLWIRSSGVPRFLRLMLLGTYLFFFEYGVISRSYTLGVFLAFLFCRLYDPRGLRVVRPFVVLVLLSFTSVYGCTVAVGLGAYLLWQTVEKLRHTPLGPRHRRELREQWLIGLLLVGVALLVHLKTSLPPADAFYATIPGKRAPIFSSAGFGLQFWSGVFPWRWRNESSWIVSNYFGQRLPWFRDQLLPASLVVFALWLIALRRAPGAALVFFVGVAAIALFQSRQYGGYLRHWGHFFVLQILALWLFAKHGRPRAVLLYCLATATMAVQIATNVSAVKAEIRLPFSGAKETADFLRSHHLTDETILGTYDHAVSNVAGHLDRKFRWAETQSATQTVTFRRGRYDFPPQARVLEWAETTVRKLGHSVLLVVNYRLREQRATLKVDWLFSTKPTVRSDESFTVYRVSLAPSPP